MEFRVVIPARYASSRLPGKVLLDIAGKPVIQHVYERAVQSGAEQVIIATDDQRVVDLANSISAEVVLTSSDHQSGTDRIAEVVRKLKFDDDVLIVNLQGDEPMVDPAIIQQVAGMLDAEEKASMATLASKINTNDELFNPNIVKVVIDKAGCAMYFSRASIPWNRELFPRTQSASNKVDMSQLKNPYFRHIGLYAYRAQFIKTFVKLEVAPQEKAECLEQLRALHHGYSIRVDIAIADQGVGVDTEEEYQRVKSLMES